MFDCVVCGQEVSNNQEHYFVVPGFIMVPNCYLLCDKHKHLRVTFEDLYNEDGSRKKIKINERIKTRCGES